MKSLSVPVISALLGTFMTASGCSHVADKEQDRINKLALEMINANPHGDAEAAIAKNDLRYLAYSSNVLIVPGVGRCKADPDNVRRIGSFAHSGASFAESQYVLLVRGYAAEYNMVVSSYKAKNGLLECECEMYEERSCVSM